MAETERSDVQSMQKKEAIAAAQAALLVQKSCSMIRLTENTNSSSAAFNNVKDTINYLGAGKKWSRSPLHTNEKVQPHRSEQSLKGNSWAPENLGKNRDQERTEWMAEAQTPEWASWTGSPGPAVRMTFSHPLSNHTDIGVTPPQTKRKKFEFTMEECEVAVILAIYEKPDIFHSRLSQRIIVRDPLDQRTNVKMFASASSDKETKAVNSSSQLITQRATSNSVTLTLPSSSRCIGKFSRLCLKEAEGELHCEVPEVEYIKADNLTVINRLQPNTSYILKTENETLENCSVRIHTCPEYIRS
ncbi:Protein of unknown function [Gryllus bimaculatus]|nr:Protein of unknown function [Gryllus bimaculatus]